MELVLVILAISVICVIVSALMLCRSQKRYLELADKAIDELKECERILDEAGKQ